MTEQNSRAVIGGNNPPDPIDEIGSKYADAIAEALNWLDGSTVENEGQMKHVDGLRKEMREYRMAVQAGQKEATEPLHEKWKGEIARWKPTLDDAVRMENGLKNSVDKFKKKLADEKAEKTRLANIEAAKARKEAEALAAAAATTTDIDAIRAADAAKEKAEAANKQAAAAKKDTVTGLRTVKKHAIDDYPKALNWIAKNDRDAVTEFITEYVRKNFKTSEIAGVRVWEDKQAY